MRHSTQTIAAASALLVSAGLFGLWKIERSYWHTILLGPIQGIKSPTAIRQLAAQKNKYYKGDPAQDDDAQEVKGSRGRDNPTHAVANSYGYRNIIGPDKGSTP